jgi:hypothetical protein
MNDNPSRGQPQRRRARLAPREPPDYDFKRDCWQDDDLPTHDDRGVPFAPINPTDLPADIVLGRLLAQGLRITGSGPSWQATCPAHLDSKPSLSITETDRGVLLMCCRAGCPTETVLSKTGLTFRHLYPSESALRSGKRCPQGTLPFHGGSTCPEIIAPTAEECVAWKRRLKQLPIPRYALKQLGVQLGLPPACLVALRVGYDPEENSWLFPECDDRRRIVGLVRRYPDGDKRTIEGSRRGLTLPRYDGALPPGPCSSPRGPAMRRRCARLAPWRSGAPAPHPATPRSAGWSASWAAIPTGTSSCSATATAAKRGR